jgi:hypothetical protein
MTERQPPVRNLAAVLVICVALVAGCDRSSPAPASPTVARETTSSAAASPPTTTAAARVNANPGRFDPKEFGGLAGEPNPWLPLTPGYQSVRDGTLFRGHRELHHRLRTTVTDVAKRVDGVRTVLVLDQDIDAGEIAEQSLDYLAQDRRGNVWYLGSYTESYEGGQFVNASDAWLAGVNGAVPGVAMLADPKPGTPSYPQARVPGRETLTARVAKLGESKCVPFRCFTKVLAILESGTELKYYASGVGPIATEPNYSGGEQEKEALVNLVQLTSQGLTEASQEALRLDEHARGTAKAVFAGSAPARRTR